MPQETASSLGERIRALEVLQTETAKRAAEDRDDMKERFEAASQEMRTELSEVRHEVREQLDEVRTSVKANSAAVMSLTQTIQSYSDKAAGAMTMGAAFKALVVVTGGALVTILGLAITYGGKFLAFIHSTPPPPR